MPESKHRKNRSNRAAAEASSSPLRDAEPFDFKDLDGEDDSLPTWYKVTMFGLMLLGLLWIILWYISNGALPVSAAGSWNIAIGFGVAMVGFFMTMRWK